MTITKEDNFIKDAFILFAITLVSGILLGLVYEITKDPIEQATIASNNATYQEVLADASSFDEMAGSAEKIAEITDSGEIDSLGFGKVGLTSVLEGKDSGGDLVGYVVNSYSNSSYGGKVAISVGFDTDGVITGLGITETSDTPGLGLKARDASFRDQYIGKNADVLSVTKSGNAGDDEIDAISGATVTSNAVTNAVNLALYYLHNYIE